MKILITGATGLIGKKICQALFLEGHELVILSRNPERAGFQLSMPGDYFASIGQALSSGKLADLDAVIHLAGESISERWTEERKRRVYSSRVEGTRELMSALHDAYKKGSLPRLKSVVSASAIGYYGDRKDEKLTEGSICPLKGKSFLSDVCQAWERESLDENPLGVSGVRLCAIRTGIVLSSEGGALSKMLPLFRAGLGGVLAGGKAYMSWIHIDDLVALFLEALRNPKYQGRINGVSPEPATNREFTHALAESLKKPALFAVPAFALKASLGEMSELVLASQKVIPEKALALGFEFKYRELKQAFATLFEADAEWFESFQWIPKSKDQIFEFFSDAKNLETLTPPLLEFKIKSVSTPQVQQGTLIQYRLKIHGVPVGWTTLIDEWTPGVQFVDTQLKGPYSLWHHTHEFKEFSRGAVSGTWMKDRVRYRLPLGFIGRGVAGSFVRSDVEQIFDYRRKRIFELFGTSKK